MPTLSQNMIQMPKDELLILCCKTKRLYEQMDPLHFVYAIRSSILEILMDSKFKK